MWNIRRQLNLFARWRNNATFRCQGCRSYSQALMLAVHRCGLLLQM